MTTHIAFVLDRSGSMGSMAAEAAGSVNGTVKSLKGIKGSKAVTINQFDNIFESTCSAVAVTKVPELIVGKNYQPRGTTALYDAIGRTIVELGNKKNVIMYIVTDGAENASHDFNYTRVKSLIDEKTSKGWKFEFLSSDIEEATRGGVNLVGQVNTMSFADTGAGYSARSAHMTASATAYMANVEDNKAKKVVTK
jgi:hypothetical protein